MNLRRHAEVRSEASLCLVADVTPRIMPSIVRHRSDPTCAKCYVGRQLPREFERLKSPIREDVGPFWDAMLDFGACRGQELARGSKILFGGHGVADTLSGKTDLYLGRYLQ